MWYPGSGVVLDCIDSGSCHFFLFLFNGLRKQDPMQSLLNIISPFCLDFNKLNKTGTQMLDSLYHIKLKLLCNYVFGVKPL